MNNHHLAEICNKMGIHYPKNEPTRVYGGLLHLMWRLDADSKSYAIKQLSKDIKLSEEVKNNYELTEKIAFRFKQSSIPAISAIEIEGKHVIEISNIAYLIYPWIDSQSLDKDIISDKHALQISPILAKMHLINLDVPELMEPEFAIHQSEKIIALIEQAVFCKCLFVDDLKKNQERLVAINDIYQKNIPFLKETLVVSHGDLDQKNVLWDRNSNPILIDWESARKLNPSYEIIDTALNWSGITTANFNELLFMDMLKAYINVGGIVNKNQINPAFYGIQGNWLNWMVYNIERACKIDPNEADQQKLGTEQVQQVLPTILRLKKTIPQLTALIREEL